jgi:hypothetical protein
MIPKEYRMPIIGLLLAVGLWLASLYQLEILWIWLNNGKYEFEFPFYLMTISIYMARDFWYLVNGISLALGIYSGAVFNVKRMELRMKNVKPTS